MSYHYEHNNLGDTPPGMNQRPRLSVPLVDEIIDANITQVKDNVDSNYDVNEGEFTPQLYQGHRDSQIHSQPFVNLDNGNVGA